MRTGNPALNAKTFVVPRLRDAAAERGMTIEGTVNRTGLLLVLLLLGAGWSWRVFYAEGVAATMPYIWGGALGGFVVALVTIFKKEWAAVTAPVYAVLEGLCLGALSGFFETQFPGIVLQAVGLTFGTLLALLVAYKSGVIKATENFKLGVVAATGGSALVYITTLVLGFFGVQIPFIHGSGPLGILFSLFVVVIAALNLVLDFDFIESGGAQGAPRFMEWYAAFGLMGTLIWLYPEILRLLAKLRSRD